MIKPVILSLLLISAVFCAEYSYVGKQACYNQCEKLYKGQTQARCFDKCASMLSEEFPKKEICLMGCKLLKKEWQRQLCEIGCNQIKSDIALADSEIRGSSGGSRSSGSSGRSSYGSRSSSRSYSSRPSSRSSSRSYSSRPSSRPSSRSYSSRPSSRSYSSRPSSRSYSSRPSSRSYSSRPSSRSYSSRPSYGRRQQPSYGRRQQSYGRRQQSYGRRQQSYGRRQQSYGRRQQSYGRRQQPSYRRRQQPSYGRRQPSYGRRQPSYGRRQPSYGRRPTQQRPQYQRPVQQPQYQRPVQQPQYQRPVQQPQAPVQPTNYRPQTGDLSVAQLSKIMPNANKQRLEAMAPYINQAMREGNINTPKRQAAFLAQLAHESGSLRYMEEIASGKKYEGRRDLGNTHPGDGVRYKGRGPIQLTGRANYEKFGKALGLDLVNHPELAAKPEVGFRIAQHYWNSRNLNHYADQGTQQGFDTITKRINGGFNGKQDRDNFYHRAEQVLEH